MVDVITIRCWRCERGREVQVCSRAGCPELVDSGPCPACARQADRQRGTRQQRGYDAAYDAQRRADTQALTNGAVLICWRCGGVVMPHDYSLGHCDDDRGVIHGPEHLRQCNLANTRGGCPHPTHRNISPVT